MVLKFEVDIKTIRKGFAIAEMDIPSDEEIKSKLSDHITNLTALEDEDVQNALLGFAMMAIGSAYDK